MSSGTNADAIPVLVGGLAVGEEAGVRWGFWPLEVYPTGCLVRIRLAPTVPWKSYEARQLWATVTPLDGHELAYILVETDDGHELVANQSSLPAADGAVRTYEPWDLAWTLHYWWPREDWRNVEVLTLSWPERRLRLRLPVDHRAILLAAGPVVPSSLTPGQ